MLDLKRKLIERVLTDDEFISLDGLKGSTVKDCQEIAFNMFFYNILDGMDKNKPTEIGNYNDEKMFDSCDEMREAIGALEKIIKQIERDKFTIETKDLDENYMVVYQFDIEDEEEITDFLKCSCLEYKKDVDYEELQNELEEEIEEIEAESEEFRRNPYGYYGVSRKDF